MHLTVAICTLNRCKLLAHTLDGLTRLVIPDGVTWEVVVVNNNGTDDTDAVVDSFHDRLPVRRLLERTPGKSHALNLAAHEARGDYILWTDDDVLVDPDWLSAYHRAFERWPAAAVFGGRIEPWFEGTPPRWLARVLPRVEGVYAMRDPGAEPSPLSHERVPYGANMAVRRAEQLRYPYDPELGPRPGSVFGGEETAMIRAMLDDGLHGWWVPAARVHHHIPASRQTASYIRRYCRGFGETVARREPQSSTATLLGRPLWLWRELAAAELRYPVRRILALPEVWVEDLVAVGVARGKWRAYGRPRA